MRRIIAVISSLSLAVLASSNFHVAAHQLASSNFHLLP